MCQMYTGTKSDRISWLFPLTCVYHYPTGTDSWGRFSLQTILGLGVWDIMVYSCINPKTKDAVDACCNRRGPAHTEMKPTSFHYGLSTVNSMHFLEICIGWWRQIA